jgi:hypothetical protein
MYFAVVDGCPRGQFTNAILVQVSTEIRLSSPQIPILQGASRMSHLVFCLEYPDYPAFLR